MYTAHEPHRSIWRHVMGKEGTDECPFVAVLTLPFMNISAIAQPGGAGPSVR